MKKDIYRRRIKSVLLANPRGLSISGPNKSLSENDPQLNNEAKLRARLQSMSSKHSSSQLNLPPSPKMTVAVPSVDTINENQHHVGDILDGVSGRGLPATPENNEINNNNNNNDNRVSMSHTATHMSGMGTPVFDTSPPGRFTYTNNNHNLCYFELIFVSLVI